MNKWKELGKHISNIISLSPEEKVINSIPVYNFDEDRYIVSFTKNGMVKRTKLSDFKVQRYTKEVNMMNLKDEDRVINVDYSNLSEVFGDIEDEYDDENKEIEVIKEDEYIVDGMAG